MSEESSMSDDSAPDPDLSGRQLGDYRLLRRLGRGAMAEVYLAEQCSLRRRVAFKVLKRRLAKDRSYLQRFHNEAQAAAALVHANIVQIHEVGQVDGTHYIVQEYVPGRNLSQYLSRHGALEVPPAVRIMRQVAAALHKAGQNGIVHRDVKPENILLSVGGEVKVVDFGLARLTSDRQALHLTQVGVTMGTPLYMSPEQAEGQSLDPRSDIYSFGVTCYHMLAGHPPFTGDTALSVAVQHLKADPPLLQTLRPDLPDRLCRIVHKMLAKHRDDRYGQASELLRDLRQLPVEGPDELNIEDDMASSVAIGGTVRLEVTQRLEALMKTVPSAASSRRRVVMFVAPFAAVAILLGMLLGFWVRQPPLLPTSGQQQRSLIDVVKKRDFITAQYFYAMRLNTEEGWRSVAEHFPADQSETNKVYAHRARLQLARLYLQPDYDAPDQALAIFQELEGLDETQQEFRAQGIAGQAQVYYLRGKYPSSVSKLRELMPLEHHLDRYTRNDMQQLERDTRRAMRRLDARQNPPQER